MSLSRSASTDSRQRTLEKGRPANGENKVLSVLRALPVAVVAALAPTNPNFALRLGAVACALVLLGSITRIRVRAADICMVAYTGLVAVSTFWTINQEATLLSIQNTTGSLLIFLAVRTAGANRIGWRMITGGLVAGCCYVVYRIFNDNQLQDVGRLLDATGTRYGLQDINANYLAYSMATGASIALVLAAWLGGRRHFFAWVGVLALLLGGIITSGTRGAVLGLALAAIWLVGTRLVRPASTFPLKALLVGLALSAMSIVSGVFQSIAQAYTLMSLRERGDLNGRFAVWPHATEWWLDHFWVGSGAGTFPEVSVLHIAAHNFVLDVGTGVGLAGVALFVGVIYFSVWKETRGLPSRVALVGAYCLVTAPILMSGFWIESPVFWAGLGLIGVVGRSWSAPDTGSKKPRSQSKESIDADHN